MTLNEYQAMLRRKRGSNKTGEYSLGHQVMYQVPCALMRGTKQKILDVGFGIGYGLDILAKADVIQEYVGFEPDRESFDYVKSRHKRGNVELHNLPFDERATFEIGHRLFDHVLCIEVIEHVPIADHRLFLMRIMRALDDGGTLWLSTPDVDKHEHGVLNKYAYDLVLQEVGLNRRTIHEDQWTTLYVCQ